MNIDFLAAQVLKVSQEEANRNNKAIEDIDARYYWNPQRGGLHVIIKPNGEKLAASSSISYEKLLKAFKDGKRN